MPITYRVITSDEFPTFARTDGLAFGSLMTDDDVEIERYALERDRAIAAFEDGAMVGTTATLSLELTVPGGAVLSAGGLTWTAVIPTHRRRGILSAMIAEQLTLGRRRGEPMAVLLASEGRIYGRFGYGPATWSVGASIARASSAFGTPLTGDGRIRMLTADDAARVLPGIFDRYRPQRPGSLSRTAGLWRTMLADPAHHRDGASQLYHVVYEAADGSPDGYASYRFKHCWGEDGIPRGTVVVTELVAATDHAYAALWRYCLDMDLATSVEAKACAIDEPVRWLLADPRQFRTTRVTDFLWLRLLDVTTCLESRRYAAEGELILEVWGVGGEADTGDTGDTDDPRRYLLAAAPEGATCSATTRSPDLVLGVAELSAAYLGGTSFASLAQGGRVEARGGDALGRADRLFATIRPPWCTTHF